MTKQEKYALVDALVDKLQNTNYFYITDTSGMSVAQINDFRGACFKKGLEYRVVKNKLIAKALERLDTDYTEFSEKVLKGFSGIIFSTESGKVPAEVIKDFTKKSKLDKPALKGASIDSAIFIGAEHLDTLSKIKSKEELLGEVIGLLQSPITNVLGALQSGGHTISGILKTLEERGEAA
jgi:large subunit ribosomal protein L10